MATKREVASAVRDLRWSQDEVSALASKLLRTKLRVYRKTLRNLIEQHAPSAKLRVSPEVKQALAAEALASARQIASTRNEAAVRIATKINKPDKSASQLRAELNRLLRQRQNKRASLIAVTEAYGPHSDATMSFFSEHSDSVQMSFGERPDLGDEPPECPICQALIAGNPWSVKQAIAIGQPHPQCRQSWHADLSGPLPEEMVVGTEIAGIVGKPSLVERIGSQDAAAAVIQRRAL